MVSPPHKQGALFAAINENFVIQAAADGHAITYVADYPTETEPAGYATDPAGGVQVFSSRGAGGWQTRDLTVPHETDPGIPIGSSNEYQFFSRDLSQAALHPFGHLIACGEGRQPPACLSPAASVQTAFLQDTSTGVFTPLVTGCLAGVPCSPAVEEAANELPGALSEPAECGAAFVPCGPSLGGGATPDFAHVILGGLVEWSAGVKGLAQLRPVGLLPPKEGKALPPEFPVLGHGEEHGAYVTRNAISSDGSRVVFEASDEGTRHLYLRVNAMQPESAAEGERCVEPAKACTLQLDAGLEGIPQFQAASSSGSRVFFTETTGPDAGDLFVYEPQATEPKPEALATGVLGLIPGSSEDGSYVYFVSNSRLAAGAVNGTCLGVSGLCNLYVARDSGGGWGAPRLVAVLAGQDENDWSPTQKSLPSLTARVSPDGRWLAFMSQRSLTSYDNTDVDEHPTKKEEELGVGSLVRVRHHDEEVFEYHAPEHLEVEGGSLVCASCNPTGERPHGVKGAPAGQLFNGFAVWREVFLAANVPGWTPFALSAAVYQSRYLSDSGRLFFDAHDALVPEDVNGTGDVYEYEPEGVGSCTSSSSSGSVVYKPVRVFERGEEPAGCVALISSGSSAQESAFLDASESGSDVFFLTTSKLVPQDFDSALDVYDAHECTGGSPCLPPQPVAPAPCDTEASCKAAPSPQPSIYGLPASGTFSGPGNFAPARPSGVARCKKGFARARNGKCIRRKRKRKARHRRRT